MRRQKCQLQRKVPKLPVAQQFAPLPNGVLGPVSLGMMFLLPVAKCLDSALEVGFFTVEVVRSVIAVRIAHVIEVVSAGRVDGGSERGQSGRADRTGR